MNFFTSGDCNALANFWIAGLFSLPGLTERRFAYGESAFSTNKPSFVGLRLAGKSNNQIIKLTFFAR